MLLIATTNDGLLLMAYSVIACCSIDAVKILINYMLWAVTFCTFTYGLICKLSHFSFQFTLPVYVSVQGSNDWKINLIRVFSIEQNLSFYYKTFNKYIRL